MTKQRGGARSVANRHTLSQARGAIEHVGSACVDTLGNAQSADASKRLLALVDVDDVNVSLLLRNLQQLGHLLVSVVLRGSVFAIRGNDQRRVIRHVR